MDIHINNHFIQTFVSKYQENASKAVKYLAVLGIHFLETVDKKNLPFSELQSIAKSILQTQPGQESTLNKELQVIKDELAQLNKKIDSKIGSPVMPSHEKKEKIQNIPAQEYVQHAAPLPLPLPGQAKNASSLNKFDPKVLTHKPPSAWREGDKRAGGRRIDHLENMDENYDSFSKEHGRARASPANRSVDKRDSSLGSSKGEYYITPKPNEIVLPPADLKASKNNMTRHHLDDTEAKKLLNEEGVIFFPSKGKGEIKETPKVTRESRKEQLLGESPFFGRERPPQQPEESFNAEWSDMVESSSPYQTRESTTTKLFSTATIQANKENYKPPQNRPGKKEEQKNQMKPDIPRRNQPKPANEPFKKKPSKNRSSYSQLASSKTSASQDYGHVPSKIKDEVNYHKELSKQYKKMKQSMSQSEGFTDDFVLSSSTRFEPARENIQEQPRNLERGPNRWGTTQNQFNQYEDVPRNRQPQLMESTDSTQRSSLTMQQLSANTFENRRPAENTRPQQRFEETERNDEDHFYRSRTENRGGMLDIANSFLNSPLMQHITSTEPKNFDTSFKDSMVYSTQQRHPGLANYASGPDFAESTGFMQSRSGNFGTEEDLRFQSSQGLQQSKYSNAGNNLYQPGRVGRRTNSLLKDSTNRRFQENMNNELGASYGNKEGISSLASSNFSNFLNDEMKGFYQKERLDLKKPKSSELIMKFGSSEASESMSFNGNEPPLNNSKVEKKSLFYRNEFGDNLEDNTNNKTFGGISFDNANVFKDERMSVTQILDN